MAQTLGSVAVGTLVKLNEDGSPVEFYVAKHDYESGLNGTGRTLVVRKDVYEQLWWNNSSVNAYASSQVDNRLNSTYKSVLDEEIQELIGTTKIQYTPGNGNWAVGTLERAVFLLSLTELGKSRTTANVEGSALPIASTLIRVSFGGGPFTQWTRTPNTSSGTSVWMLQVTGDEGTFGTVNTAGVRPAFTLPGTLFVQSDGSISKTIPAPKTITVPVQSMQGHPIPVSWSAVDGADGYILERKANTDVNWTQVYSGAGLTFNETAGDWETVQYRVKSGAYNIYGEYTISAVVPVAGSAVLVISGSDGDLGTLVNDVSYTVSSDGTNPLTVTEIINGTTARTFTATNGANNKILVVDLPTGTGTIKITASTNPGSGVVTVTRNWTYTKTAPTFANAGSTAQLQWYGKNVFPLTLLECVRGGENLAPGGYGLGTPAQLRASANDCKLSGWYMTAFNVPNAPDGDGGYWLIRVDGRDDTVLYQTAYANRQNSGVPNSVICRRYYVNSEWSPWEYITPPMQLGVEYRTVERYNGKPVYAKAINFGQAPNATYKEVSHGIEDFSQLVSYTGMMGGANLIEAPALDNILINASIIRITTNTDASGSYVYLVLRYIKTTD